MKRLLSILLLLFLLSGCSQGEDTQWRSSVPERSVRLSSPVLTRPAPPTLLDELIALDGIENVYEIKTEAIEGMLYPSITEFDGRLLLCSQYYTEGSGTLEVRAMNCYTGSVAAQTSFAADTYMYPQVRGDKLYFCDSSMGWVKALDRELQLIFDTQVESDENQWLINGDGTKLYQLSFMNDAVVRELSSGEVQPLAPDLYNVFPSDRNDEYACLSYVGTQELLSCVGSLDYDTGTIETAPFDATLSSVNRCGDRWLGYRFDGAYAYYDGTKAWVIQPQEEFHMVLLEHTGHLLTHNYGEHHLVLYDTDGTFLSECVLDLGPECYPNDDLVWSDFYGGYFLTVTAPDGSTRLLLWLIDGEATGGNLELLEEADYESVPPGTAVDPALYERAKRMSDQYGLEILIADQCDTEFSDYLTVQVTDEAAITNALDTLEKALTAYPEGFIAQLNYDTIRKIQIQLCGPLTGRDGYSMSTAGAFTQPAGEVYLMVMDIYQYQLEANYYHEFSHIIDHNLDWHAQYQDTLFSEDTWRDLSPEYADYSFTYADWPSTWNNGLDAYFVDDYARTYPTEDRARIMEYAMMDWDWVFDEEHAPILEKLRYYAECIRDCFDTTLWPEVTVWEELLAE